METPIETIYSQYERWRSSKTAEEHANLFLAWLLTYKEWILEQEKKGIVDAVDDGREYRNLDVTGEKYYNIKFKKD